MGVQEGLDLVFIGFCKGSRGAGSVSGLSGFIMVQQGPQSNGDPFFLLLYIPVCLSVPLSVCLAVRLSVCLSGLSGLSVGFGTGSWGLPVSSFGVCDPNSWPLGFRVVRFEVSASGFSVCRSRGAARKVLLA